MEKCISCGKFNNSYYYIILIFIFDLLNDSLYGFNYLDLFKDLKLINTKTQAYFSWHHLIHQIFNYFGTFIFSYCFCKYEKHLSKGESEPSTQKPSNKESKNIQIKLIHNNLNEYIEPKNINFYICLLIILIWIIEEQLLDFYNYALKDLDFWMIELIILSLLSKKMFKYQLYKHHLLSISMCIFSSLLKVGCIFITFTNIGDDKDGKNYNGNLPIFYSFSSPLNNSIRIILGITFYFLLIFIRSYISLKLKWFMDKKNFSHIKLFTLYGISSIIIYIIISLIGNFREHDYQKGESILDYLFKVVKKVNETNETYLENFSLYLDNYRSKEILNITREIITIILGLFFFSFKKYFSILIIKYLSPVYVIISIPILFLLQKFVMLFNLLIHLLLCRSGCNGFCEDIKNNLKNSIEFCFGNKKKKIKFFLDISGDFFSIIGFLIYLEIIVVKCYKYDYNTTDNIMRRSFGEINNNSDDNESEIILNESDIKEFEINEKNI